MNKPDIVAGLKPLYVNGTDYKDYCDFINHVVRWTAVGKGYWRGDTIIFQDESIRFIYVDNEYGNDKYTVEINREIWNEIPDDIDPQVVNFGGKWNCVYQFMDGRDALLWHIPGNWFRLLTKYSNENTV